jgi:hypothetical protein
MAVLLFRLNGVPDDEADEVRALFDEHGIAFYETSAGRWGISLAAIWLCDESQQAEAQGLLEAYQEARTLRVRSEYERLRHAGRHETWCGRLYRNPVRFLLYVGAALLILYFSLMPFFSLR